MTFLHTILATTTASEELPDILHHIALGSFLAGAILSIVLLVTSCVVRGHRSWFIPMLVLALVAGGLALTYVAYVYKIDYVAVDRDGTKASPPIWRSLSVPSLPLILSFAALMIYRKRTSAT